MLNPSEVTVAFASVTKLVNVVLKAFPGASHEEIARQTLAAWTEKYETLEEQLTKLQARKTKSIVTTASINTKQGAIDNLDSIEPILNSMLEIMRAQGKPALAAVKPDAKPEIKKAA